MEELVERLVRWNLHPADIITHRFRLERAATHMPYGVGQVRQSRGLRGRRVGAKVTTNWEHIPEGPAETVWPPQLGGDRRFGISGPVQAGIETIAADDEQATVIERAFAILRECKHVNRASTPTKI